MKILKIKQADGTATEEQFFTVTETAQALGITTQAIYNYIHAGKITPFVYGKMYLISAATFEALKREAADPTNKRLQPKLRHKHGVSLDVVEDANALHFDTFETLNDAPEILE